jgi:hypothetical protein
MGGDKGVGAGFPAEKRVFFFSKIPTPILGIIQPST